MTRFASAKVVNIFYTTKYFNELLYGDKEIVFLTTLCKNVFATDEVILCQRLVLVGKLLLVDRDTATLYHLAHLTL